MRLGSFITTFDRPGTLEQTIRAVVGQTRPPDLLAVVDNGTNPLTRDVVHAFPDVLYVQPGENLGSAGGTAFGMELLTREGCEWINSVDDDNAPRTPDTLERLLALADRHSGSSLGAVAATGARWDWRRGLVMPLGDRELSGDLEIDIIGGSNQLTVHRRVIEELGPPEKRFFFGFYDPLFSLRMKQAGFRLWIDGDLMRSYRQATSRIGRRRKRSPVPRDPQYAVWRRYYVSRNYIDWMLRVFDRKDLAYREAARALGRSLTSWARGPSFGLLYTSMQMRGVLDGFRGRLGKTVDPIPKPTSR